MCLLIRDGVARRANRFSKTGEDLSIQSIRLRELFRRSRRVPHLPGINHCDRKCGGCEHPCQWHFEPPVAPSMIKVGCSVCRHSTALVIPGTSFDTWNTVPGWTAIPTAYCEISTPTKIAGSWYTSVSLVLARCWLEALSTVLVDDRRNRTIQADPRSSATSIFAIGPAPVMP